MFVVNGPDLDAARRRLRRAHEEALEGARHRGRGLVAHLRQARAGRDGRPLEGVGPRRLGGGRLRDRCASSWAARRSPRSTTAASSTTCTSAPGRATARTRRASAASTCRRTASARVPLEDVTSFRAGTGPSEIKRLNRRRQVTILANMNPGFSSQAAIDLLAKETRAMNLDPSYTYRFIGRSKEQGRAAQNFLLAFALSFIFMYLILAAQFESWLHPITILLVASAHGAVRARSRSSSPGSRSTSSRRSASSCCSAS